jgi:hypothetical protein
MKTKFTKSIFLLFSIFFFLSGNAQQSVNVGGANGTGSGGSMSYSIGQTDYVNATGTGGSLNEGAQQPFEIMVLGNDEHSNIMLQSMLYPNPTTANVNLSIADYSLENLEFQLFDIAGKIISKQKITEQETTIPMENLSSGTYFVTVFEQNKLLKTFKVIKR